MNHSDGGKSSHTLSFAAVGHAQFSLRVAITEEHLAGWLAGQEDVEEQLDEESEAEGTRPNIGKKKVRIPNCSLVFMIFTTPVEQEEEEGYECDSIYRCPTLGGTNVEDTV